MEFRHGPDAVLGQELGLVEHALQYLLQAVPADQGQQEPVVLTATLHAGNVTLSYIRPVLNEPVDSSLERRELLHYLRLQG